LVFRKRVLACVKVRRHFTAAASLLPYQILF
jgi:hypothetical protein